MAKKHITHDGWFMTPHSFGGLPPEPDQAQSAGIIVLPIPYEVSTTYRCGCRQGPGAIIEASTNMELYDEGLSVEPHLAGIATSRPLEPADDPEQMLVRIEAVAADLIGQKKFIAALGGEHTVSLGMVRAMSKAHKDLSVLVLDAHADFRDTYHGNRFNHGCVSRRISEICPLSQAGIRSLSKEEADFLKGQRREPLWAHEIRSHRTARGRRRLLDSLVDTLSDNVYLSIDADALDPSIMPAVGTPEPGGLLWDEVLDIVTALCQKRNVVGVDFVELAPIPGIVHPEFLAARLLYKIFGFVFGSTLSRSMGS